MPSPNRVHCNLNKFNAKYSAAYESWSYCCYWTAVQYNTVHGSDGTDPIQAGRAFYKGPPYTIVLLLNSNIVLCFSTITSSTDGVTRHVYKQTRPHGTRSTTIGTGRRPRTGPVRHPSSRRRPESVVVRRVRFIRSHSARSTPSSTDHHVTDLLLQRRSGRSVGGDVVVHWPPTPPRCDDRCRKQKDRRRQRRFVQQRTASQNGPDINTFT